MSKKRIWIIIGVIALVVIGGVLYGSTVTQGTSERATSTTPLETNYYTVGRGSIVRTLSVTGNLIPLEDRILTFPSGGRVKEVLVEEGQAVSAGQVLVRLDDTDARVGAIQAQREYEQALVEAPPGIVEERRLSHLIAQRKLEDTALVAPFDGIVAELKVRPGDNLGNNAEVARLLDLSGYRVETTVDQSDLRYLAPGQPVTLRVDTMPGVVFDGELERIGVLPSSSDSVVTFPASIRIDVPAIAQSEKDRLLTQLRPGLSVQADIVIEQAEDVLIVPIASIVETGPSKGLTSRRVPGGADEMVEVTTGLTDGLMIEITSGLEEGDEIVTNSYQLFEDVQERGSRAGSSSGRGGFGPALPGGAVRGLIR